MRTVYKYDMPPADLLDLDMPAGADILSFEAQREKLVLWALVDPDAKLETRSFRMAGTGHAINEKPRELSYIGTSQLMDGSLVLHLFEIVRGR